MDNQTFGAEYLEMVEEAAYGGRMAKDPKSCYVQDFTEAIICA